jgi:peptidoglycan hydrolase-like protein with peptidoglycan-binding domain
MLTFAFVSAVASSNSTTDTAKSKNSKTGAKASTKRSSAKTRPVSTRSTSHRKKSRKLRGQQKIDSERAQKIQEALIREHYLSGEPTGTWNPESEAAMRRYQADHGWQNKTVPDSRALIKLGLGPSKDHLLNPESAMTTVPDAPKAETLPTTSNSAPATATPVPPGRPASSSSRPQ